MYLQKVWQEVEGRTAYIIWYHADSDGYLYQITIFGHTWESWL